MFFKDKAGGGSLKLGSEQRDRVPCVPGIQVPRPAGDRHTCLPADTGYAWSVSPLTRSPLCHGCFSHDMCWHPIPRRWASTLHSGLKYQVPLTHITEAGEAGLKGEGYGNQGKGRSKGGSLAPNPCSHGPGSSSSLHLSACASPTQSRPSELSAIVPTKSLENRSPCAAAP